MLTPPVSEFFHVKMIQPMHVTTCIHMALQNHVPECRNKPVVGMWNHIFQFHKKYSGKCKCMILPVVITVWLLYEK